MVQRAPGNRNGTEHVCMHFSHEIKSNDSFLQSSQSQLHSFKSVCRLVLRLRSDRGQTSAGHWRLMGGVIRDQQSSHRYQCSTDTMTVIKKAKLFLVIMTYSCFLTMTVLTSRSFDVSFPGCGIFPSTVPLSKTQRLCLNGYYSIHNITRIKSQGCFGMLSSLAFQWALKFCSYFQK